MARGRSVRPQERRVAHRASLIPHTRRAPKDSRRSSPRTPKDVACSRSVILSATQSPRRSRTRANACAGACFARPGWHAIMARTPCARPRNVPPNGPCSQPPHRSPIDLRSRLVDPAPFLTTPVALTILAFRGMYALTPMCPRIRSRSFVLGGRTWASDGRRTQFGFGRPLLYLRAVE